MYSRRILSVLAVLIAAWAISSGSSPVDIPRPEHPRPDFERADRLNLNGTWEFRFDPEDRGIEEEWWQPAAGLLGPGRRVQLRADSLMEHCRLRDLAVGSQ